MQYVKAVLIYAKRDLYPSGLIIEAIIWQLPGPTADRPHGLKYRLYCGRDSNCIVRYDNETGKGDHVHYSDCEQPYNFISLGQLVRDFYADIERLTGEKP
jgi:hypothetical protein